MEYSLDFDFLRYENFVRDYQFSLSLSLEGGIQFIDYFFTCSKGRMLGRKVAHSDNNDVYN